MLALLGRGLAGPARAVLGRAEPACSPVLQAARGYAKPVAKKKKDAPSHLDDLPATMLKKDYANLPIMNSVDDVVKRLLSLEMASQKEKMKVKIQQLVEKVRRSPNDNGSFEVQVAILTAKIRTLEEHLQMHPKDREMSPMRDCPDWCGSGYAPPKNSLTVRGKSRIIFVFNFWQNKDKRNRRFLLMERDRRRKMLGYLRRVNYGTFQHTCQQLGIQYSPPQPYARRLTKRWLVKKALCLKVFQEKQKMKAALRLKQRRQGQARARAAREKQEKQVQEKQEQEGTPV